MDLGLGDTDGFSVTEIIKANSELNQNTPIIAVTAHSREDYQQRAQDVGMMNFITKPLSVEKLKLLFQEIVNK